MGDIAESPLRKPPKIRAGRYLKIVLKHLKLKGQLHTFRHSFISHALTSGIPEAIVREWVGHVDPKIIRIYTHIADKQSHAAIERLFPATGAGVPLIRVCSQFTPCVKHAQKGR